MVTENGDCSSPWDRLPQPKPRSTNSQHGQCACHGTNFSIRGQEDLLSSDICQMWTVYLRTLYTTLTGVRKKTIRSGLISSGFERGSKVLRGQRPVQWDGDGWSTTPVRVRYLYENDEEKNWFHPSSWWSSCPRFALKLIIFWNFETFV